MITLQNIIDSKVDHAGRCLVFIKNNEREYYDYVDAIALIAEEIVKLKEDLKKVNEIAQNALRAYKNLLEEVKDDQKDKEDCDPDPDSRRLPGLTDPAPGGDQRDSADGRPDRIHHIDDVRRDPGTAVDPAVEGGRGIEE